MSSVGSGIVGGVPGSQQVWKVVVTTDTDAVVAEGEVRLATRAEGPRAPVLGAAPGDDAG